MTEETPFMKEKETNTLSLFVRWFTTPKELREIARIISKKHGNVCLTIDAEIPVNLMFVLRNETKEEKPC